jgi:thymidylate synthase (FAD)
MQVDYVTHSGDDLLVVDAARVSFSKASEWERVTVVEATQDGGTWEEYVHKLKDKDAKLINYLAREKHVLPFRHPAITLRCKAPLFLARQLGKHQAGMSWSEESRRYIDSPPEFWWPNKWRKRAEDKKQGSTDEAIDLASVDVQGEISLAVHVDMANAWAVNTYNLLLGEGVAPEQARMVLPQNMMVNWVWTGTLLSWAHMYKLRTGHGAQQEAVEFAELVAAQIEPLFPVSWSALMEYHNA